LQAAHTLMCVRLRVCVCVCEKWARKMQKSAEKEPKENLQVNGW